MDWRRIWRETREDIIEPASLLVGVILVPRRISLRILLLPVVAVALFVGLVLAGSVLRGMSDWLVGYDPALGQDFGLVLLISTGYGLLAYFVGYGLYAFLNHFMSERHAWRNEVRRLREYRLANR